MKINVLGLLGFLIVVGFNGCSPKFSTVTTREFCEGQEYPIRESSKTPVCQSIVDIDDKAECASTQFVKLLTDYDKLEAYVRNCR